MTYKKIGALISIVAFISVSAWLLWLWRSHQAEPLNAHFSVTNDINSGFTFFHLHRNTQLTEMIREELREKLGSGAIEKKTIIDLIFPALAKEIFNTHFPELTALNESLNYLPEERVEHDTIQLTFRYARKKGLPFDKVRLLFDNRSQLPLFFSVTAEGDGTDLLKKLEAKYGPPRKIDWQSNSGVTMCWKQEKDLLVATFTQNRIGAPEHYLGFYFINNIQMLINMERQDRNRKKTTGAAF